MSPLDTESPIEAFCQWPSDLPEDIQGKRASVDGKALASTVSDCHGSRQKFEAVVSLFVQESQLAVALGNYRNGHKSEGEGETFRELLTLFKGKGIVFTDDALHIQKNGR